MPTVYDAFDLVRAQPWAYLHESTLLHLSTFWFTYQGVMRLHGVPLDTGSPNFRHFDMWLAARRGDGLNNGGWQHLLVRDAPGADGFARFYEELDTFRQRRLTTIARANLPVPRRWPNYVSRLIGGVMSDVPTLTEVTKVELRTYPPDEAFFLIAIRSDGVETEHWCWTRDRAVALADKELSVSPTEWLDVSASAP
ncbi:MAG: hypothetical protein ABMA64_41875 [Myxococcota bacterium]